MSSGTSDGLFPVHGFVLAGGKSSRMGRDKALLEFRGRPMVEIAIEKLRGLCAEVGIAGNREDLEQFAPVVRESRLEAGPGAGVEAALHAAQQPWVMCIPVDVPLVPVELLRLWVDEVLRVGMNVSFLGIVSKQPVFCLLQRERAAAFSRLLDEGERRLEVLLNQAAAADGHASWMYDEHELYAWQNLPVPDSATLERWFANVNTLEDLAAAEAPEE